MEMSLEGIVMNTVFFKRKYLLVAACLTLMQGSALAQEKKWDNIRIATEGAYAPWNFSSPSGALDGYEIDLAKELCRRMAAKCEIVAQDWDGMLPALNAGKFDAIMAAMSVTPDRQKVAAFSIPYSKAPNAFMVLKDNPLAKALPPHADFNLRTNPDASKDAVKGLATALKGKVLGVQGGSTAAAFANAYLKGVAEIREYKTTDEENLDLEAGRADVVMANVTVLEKSLSEPDMSNATLAGPTFVEGVLGSGTTNVALRRDDDALRAKFDKAIAAVDADGTNRKLSEKWFHADITPKD